MNDVYTKREARIRCCCPGCGDPEMSWGRYCGHCQFLLNCELQDRQIARLEHLDDVEVRSGGWSHSVEVACKECKISYRFGAADNGRRFIEEHIGHATTLATPDSRPFDNRKRGDLR